MTDYSDEQERIVAEFESDAEEAALSAFEALMQETERKLEPSKSGLLNKLALFPSGDFPISLASEYKDNTWKLTASSQIACSISFDRELPGANDLKRAIVYHLVPAFTPFARIRSFASTKAKSHDYRFIDIYLLGPNRLSAIPEHLDLITMPMLNRALDEAKASGQPSHYSGLFFILRFWLSLSQNKLIPESMRLPAHINNINSNGRHKDVLDTFNGSLQSWIPLSEEDLERVVTEALFWLEKATPRLLEARQFIIDNKIDQYHKGKISSATRLYDFEDIMHIEIEGRKVSSFSRTERFPHGNIRHHYFWIIEFAQAIDKVRNAVFVFIALVTGMRKSEIGGLKFDDITQDEAGLYWIDITRYKTSIDPNYNGETDRLPLPTFVGKITDSLRTLRSTWTFYRQGFIFQSASSSIKVTKGVPQLPNTIIDYLEEATGIERLHPHRFRKTIAEILINRSERNIDLIRLLFGHHSYEMTLRYISRNPYMVRSVALALEESFSKEFHEIVTAVRDGSHSGSGADRLAKQIATRPEEFKGKRLKLSILVYVSHLLSAGSPLYVGRTAVGTYCMSGEEFDEANLPPCLIGRPRPEGRLLPDPTNCQIECHNAIVVGKAEEGMKDSIRFYEQLLEKSGDSVSAKARRKIQAKIDVHKRHLLNLYDTAAAKSLRIPVMEVY